MERIPIIKNPELFDRVIANIQKGLADGLPWLNYSFGRSERLVKSIQGKRYYTPNIYVGGNEYMLIAPDSNIGNFSFFVLDDPQQIDWFPGEQNKYTTPFSVIFWFDMRTITNDPNNRNTEAGIEWRYLVAFRFHDNKQSVRKGGKHICRVHFGRNRQSIFNAPVRRVPVCRGIGN